MPKLSEQQFRKLVTVVEKAVVGQTVLTDRVIYHGNTIHFDPPVPAVLGPITHIGYQEGEFADAWFLADVEGEEDTEVHLICIRLQKDEMHVTWLADA